MALIKYKTNLWTLLLYLFTIFIFLCSLGNLLIAIFPVSYELGHDESEHLHVAYLLEKGQRPYLDFIENHPTLFNHYLRWLWNLLKPGTVRTWAMAARITILFHILFMIYIFYKWISDLLNFSMNKKSKWLYYLLSFSFIGYYDQQLDFMWQIRPDWISYCFSFTGLYLFYKSIKISVLQKAGNKIYPIFYFTLAAILAGLGNAILPKGFTIIIGIVIGLLALVLTRQIKSDYFFNKTFIIRLISFACLSAIFFFYGVLVDCHLSGINFKTWIKANIILNSIKHLPLTNADNNPITSIAAIFSLNLFLIIMMMLWLFYKLLSRPEEKENIKRQFLTISLFIIIVNISMTAFGNGLSWPHYFIPCVISALTIYMIILLEVEKYMGREDTKKPEFRKKVLFYLAIVILFAILIRQPLNLYAGIMGLKANLSDNLIRSNPDYLNESIMPSNLIYFTPKPTEMPIRANHSGYYFMLVIDKKIWRDCYNLGLGPEPEKHIRTLFENTPPDILAFNGPIKLHEFIILANSVQNVNLTWLLEKVEKDYFLMQNKLKQLYVRKDIADTLVTTGWNRVEK
ncbi:MAG: hypothetical protein QHH43_06320 [Candidatus Saccharicenans sp.]|jgi:hypothetical protein|nr:hypothetical protein [Candidatus Saccharicenans sp.]MDH7575354.1 hypothetical protein [Candidatus Saccharicenans sp.]